MSNKYGQKIWKDGKFIEWEQATIHSLAHVVQYGSCVFEGIRTYNTDKGLAVFRLKEHLQRLLNSAKIYRMDTEYSLQDMIDASLETIRVNNFGACYIRPYIIRGYGAFGVNPLNNPIETYVAIWEWGKYLGPEALENGVDVCVSSWTRMAPNTLPTLAKAGANYMNSQLIKMEAIRYGFDEGIALDFLGYVAEGSGENLFLVTDNVIYTPSLTNGVLPGITRDVVIYLLEKMGYEVRETGIPRERLYLADELFFTGTAAEITPIRSVDKITVGNGKCGPVTQKVQDAFFGIFEGKTEVPADWLTIV